MFREIRTSERISEEDEKDSRKKEEKTKGT